MTDTAPRVLFYVQHLLGIGHVKRASLLCQALVKAGFDVHIVLGGEPSPIQFQAATIHQLDAVKCKDGDFTKLVDEQGNELGDELKSQRKQQLLRLFNDLQPDILLIELYPFGRRQFRFELLPLLELANQQPKSTLIICSLRDILVRKSVSKSHRSVESAELINRYFDRVIVHADPALVRLEDSFPVAAKISNQLLYSGYICEPPPNLTRICRDGVVVSAGGGAVGAKLLHAAIECKPHTRLADRPWTLLTGPNISEEVYHSLKHHAHASNIHIERFRDDFVGLLSRSALSISQAGYNTTMELLSSQTPALVIPYASGGETEQLQRSELLAKKGLLSILLEDSLTPLSLAKAIDKIAFTSPPEMKLALDGAQQTSLLLQKLLKEARS